MDKQLRGSSESWRVLPLRDLLADQLSIYAIHHNTRYFLTFIIAFCIGYTSGFRPLDKTHNILPTIVADLVLSHEWVYYSVFGVLGLYVLFFIIMIGILVLVQSKNLLLGRTTYERFRTVQADLIEGLPSEPLHSSIDTISIVNCGHMCCQCNLPSQNYLEEHLTRARLKSSASLQSVSSVSNINASSYHIAGLNDDANDSSG